VLLMVLGSRQLTGALALPAGSRYRTALFWLCHTLSPINHEPFLLQ